MAELDDAPYLVDRVPVPFGSQACDHCLDYLGRGHHEASPFHVTLENCDMQIAHAACVCWGCRRRLLSGEALHLHAYEDTATALFSSRCSRRETLRLLGQPYTPKTKAKAKARPQR